MQAAGRREALLRSVTERGAWTREGCAYLLGQEREYSLAQWVTGKGY